MKTAAAVLALALGAAAPAAAGFIVTVVPAADWAADDAAIGVDGGTVEDFEDRTLAPGLAVELSDGAGNFTGSALTTLANVFDPAEDDPYGSVFIDGVWDGVRVLLNTDGNEAVYYGSRDFRKVRLHVPEGTAWIGMALMQVTRDDPLLVNGQDLGTVSSLGLAPSFGRNGFLLISTDDAAEPIVSVTFGGGGDAFVVDHVVFATPGQVDADAGSWSSVKALFR
jgi:hypothetical protein